MKKSLLITTLFLSAQTFAGTLPSYDLVKATILEGKSVRIVVNFKACAHAEQKQIVPSLNIGLYTPNEMMIDINGNILASLDHFTLNDPHFNNKPVYQHVRYKLDANGTLTLTSQTLDALTYQTLSPIHEYKCQIPDSVTFYSA